MVGESGPERRSAVEQSPLEEFLATAELAGTRFVAGEGLGGVGGGGGGERGRAVASGAREGSEGAGMVAGLGAAGGWLGVTLPWSLPPAPQSA